jgi:hypothetical protein
MTERRITWRGVFVPIGELPDLAWFGRPALPRYRATRRLDGAIDLRQAELDAQGACYLARIAGADGGVIYLDTDDGELPIEYVDAWVDVVAAFRFRPGLCCSHDTLTSLVERGAIDPTEWLFRATSTVAADAGEDRDVWWVH